MSTPNSTSRPPKTPSAAEIKAARKRANLTGGEASALVHSNERSWRKWENGDRRMHPAFWELFLRKTTAEQHPDQDPVSPP